MDETRLAGEEEGGARERPARPGESGTRGAHAVPPPPAPPPPPPEEEMGGEAACQMHRFFGADG